MISSSCCQPPAIGDAVTAGPTLSSAPVCPCSPDDQHKLRVVAWSRNSREALSAPSVSCQRQYLRPMRCGGASQPSASLDPDRNVSMSTSASRPGGQTLADLPGSSVPRAIFTRLDVVLFDAGSPQMCESWIDRDMCVWLTTASSGRRKRKKDER